MADSLNYLRIASILGGTLTEIQQPSFGSIGASQTAEERFRLIRSVDKDETIDPVQYQLIASAFEKVRDGYEVDRVIIDPVLGPKFIKECRLLGIDAPIASINRHLQNFRKAPKYGIKLKKTTRASELEPEPFFYAAELGYTQLSYRRRASIDDIVTDPEVGDVYVALCKSIAPTGTSTIFKWAALRLRKMRSFSSEKANVLLDVSPSEIEKKFKTVATLDRLSVSDVPKAEGIFSFHENSGTSKYLYVGSGKDVRAAVEPFSSAKPFFALAGRFWNPLLSDISLNVGILPKKRWHGASTRDWGLRLIQERHPLFNIPVEIER